RSPEELLGTGPLATHERAAERLEDRDQRIELEEPAKPGGHHRRGIEDRRRIQPEAEDERLNLADVADKCIHNHQQTADTERDEREEEREERELEKRDRRLAENSQHDGDERRAHEEAHQRRAHRAHGKELDWKYNLGDDRRVSEETRRGATRAIRERRPW